MTQIYKFMRLDYLSIKPYFSASIVVAFVFAVVATSLSSLSGAVGMAVIFSTILAGYPFAVGEKANFNALYCQLALRRVEVVRGRYSFVLASSIAVTMVTCLFYLILAFVRQTATGNPTILFVDVFQAAVLAIVASVLIQVLQLPVFFRFNYEKARVAATLPLIAISGFSAILTIGQRNQDTIRIFENLAAWVQTNTSMLAICVLPIVLLITALSFKISLRFYLQRDF